MLLQSITSIFTKIDSCQAVFAGGGPTTYPWYGLSGQQLALCGCLPPQPAVSGTRRTRQASRLRQASSCQPSRGRQLTTSKLPSRPERRPPSSLTMIVGKSSSILIDCNFCLIKRNIDFQLILQQSLMSLFLIQPSPPLPPYTVLLLFLRPPPLRSISITSTMTDHAFNSAFASLRRRRHHAVHRVFAEGLLISYLHKRACQQGRTKWGGWRGRTPPHDEIGGGAQPPH